MTDCCGEVEKPSTPCSAVTVQTRCELALPSAQMWQQTLVHKPVETFQSPLPPGKNVKWQREINP